MMKRVLPLIVLLLMLSACNTTMPDAVKNGDTSESFYKSLLELQGSDFMKYYNQADKLFKSDANALTNDQSVKLKNEFRKNTEIYKDYVEHYEIIPITENDKTINLFLNSMKNSLEDAEWQIKRYVDGEGVEYFYNAKRNFEHAKDFKESLDERMTDITSKMN